MPSISDVVIALVVALTGTAVATSSKLSGPEAKQVGKIAGKTANKRISKRAPGLTVARAHIADNATSLGGVVATSYIRQSDLAPGQGHQIAEYFSMVCDAVTKP